MAPVQPKDELEDYTYWATNIANEMLAPQGFIEPLYCNVQAMAERLGKASEISKLINDKFQDGKTFQEASLLLMLKGLQYKTQIAATRGAKARGLAG
jgi:hypothetical protein